MAAILYVTDEEPGIRRMGHRRFRYVDQLSGEPVRDPEVLARIRALVIPPAWEDVWICADPRGHIQATGRDARGRKQYRYHARHRETREQAKFDDLVPFGATLGSLRATVDEHLALRGLPQERVVALLVTLLDRTYLRVGNEEYARQNGTFGLTTLRSRHAAVNGTTITLRFKGKGGKRHEASVADPRLARIARRCLDLPGRHLFTYDDGDEARPVTSSDVNDYLRDVTGLDVTAKTFRTWGASVLAAADLATSEPGPTERERAAEERRVVDEVAGRLGNTPAVCRRSYIHPTVLESFQDGSLPGRWQAGPARAAGGLDPEERRLLHVLDG